MPYYTVFVQDRLTKQTVCILDMASRSEASALCRQLDYLNACDVYFMDNDFYRKKESES